MRRVEAAAIVAATILLSGCAGSGGSQVIVPLDQNPNDVAGAARVAEAQCAARNARPRFVLWQRNYQGSVLSHMERPPDAVFACDPIR